MQNQTSGGGAGLLAAGAAVQLLCGIPAAWGALRGQIAQDYALSRQGTLLAFALLVGCYGAGCVAGGFVQLARGPRTAALWGCAMQAAGFGAAAFVPQGSSGWFCAVFSVPAGVGSAFLGPTVLACVQKWYVSRRGLATGVTGAGMGLSGAFYTLLVRWVGGAFGMRVCMVVLGGLTLLICGPAAARLKLPPEPAPFNKVNSKKSSGKNALTGSAQQPSATEQEVCPRQMLCTRAYWLCVGAVALCEPAVLLFGPEIIELAVQRGMNQTAAVWCVALGSAAAAAGRLCCPLGSDKLGRRRVLMFTAAGLCAGSAAFAFVQGWGVAAVYGWLTFCYAGAAAVQPALCGDLFGLKNLGVNYGFFALGMTAGSLASFAGALWLALPARHAAAALCAGGAMLCLWRLKPKTQLNQTENAQKPKK